MPLTDFKRLVKAGALPGPVKIHDLDRWRVADLDAILTGQSMSEEFET